MAKAEYCIELCDGQGNRYDKHYWWRVMKKGKTVAMSDFWIKKSPRTKSANRFAEATGLEIKGSKDAH